MHLLYADSLAFLLMVSSFHNYAASGFYCTAYYLQTGAIAVTSELYPENSLPLLLTDVNCNGSEQNLLECSYTSGLSLSCGDAAAVCQG